MQRLQCLLPAATRATCSGGDPHALRQCQNRRNPTRYLNKLEPEACCFAFPKKHVVWELLPQMQVTCAFMESGRLQPSTDGWGVWQMHGTATKPIYMEPQQHPPVKQPATISKHGRVKQKVGTTGHCMWFHRIQDVVQSCVSCRVMLSWCFAMSCPQVC